MKDLINQLSLQCGYVDEPYEYGDPSKIKFKGMPRPGDRVLIVWQEVDTFGKNLTDDGYLFTLPGFEPKDFMMGGVIHVPSPNNWGGIGEIEPLWQTLDQMLHNDMIIRLEFEH